MLTRIIGIIIVAYVFSLGLSLLPSSGERLIGLSIVFILVLLLQLRVFRWAGKMRDIAFSDELTGLRNFRFLQKALAREAGAFELDGHPISLIMIDLDRFKQYNDYNGHVAGNNALREIGKLLRGSIREGVDVAARFGGDEFALLLPGVDAHKAGLIVARLRGEIEKKFERLSISAGVQEYKGEPVHDFLARTDQLLYKDKLASNNRVL